MNAKRRMEIISDYGAVIEKRGFIVGRELDLPFPKQVIREALSGELMNPSCPELLDALEVGFLELESFLPDDEYVIVVKYERTLQRAEEVMDVGDPESATKSSAVMGDVPSEAAEILEKVQRRKHARFSELKRMRKTRGPSGRAL